MSKAIIVIDIPNIESCEIDSYNMVADLKVKSLLLGGERYDCEFENVIVRPLPRKEKGRNWHRAIAKENTYVCGWNACIDEILGEE